MFKFVVSLVLTLLTACALVVTPMAVKDHIALRTKTTPDYTQIRAATKMVYLEQFGNGSGIMIAPGRMLTAGHVAIIHSEQTPLMVDGEPIIRVIKFELEDKKDLAILEVKAGCPCVPLGDVPGVDADVAMVGFPYGKAGLEVQVLTLGKFMGFSEALNRLVTTAAVAPGTSGGGLFTKVDGEWRLIGVLVEGAGIGGPTHLSLAIPYKTIIEFLKGPLE